MIRNDLISKPSLLPSEVPGTDRSCLRGPRQAQDTPRTGVCCRCGPHTKSRHASRGCAEGLVCTRPPWPPRAESTGPALRRRGRGREDGAGWGEASGTKAGTAFGRRRPEQRRGAAESVLRPGAALGGAGPGPASWVSGAGGHTAIPAGAGDQGPARSHRPEPSLHRPHLCYRNECRAKPMNRKISGHELGDRDPHCIKQVTNKNLLSSTKGPTRCSVAT